jgi:phenylalanyl-tRNA synthetase alpha chain
MATPDVLDPGALLERFQAELAHAKTTDEVDVLRRLYAGKLSPVKLAMKGLRDLTPDERPVVAAALNTAMATITAGIDARDEELRQQELDLQLVAEWQDLSLPGTAQARGGRHPLTQVEARCMDTLRRMGFELVEGPEVETPFYNFDALNIPEHHPARDMQDTFWLPNGLLLRSHTTTVQARVLHEKRPLPIKIASAGRVYRNEAVDATHLAAFHQFEGLWIEPGLTFGHLKGVLSFVARELFGDRDLRFKPKFYPYTEPSVGLDLACGSCGGSGCGACHGAGWLTVLGAGMVHPKVFAGFGYDPAAVSGIAFGLGTTRMAAQWAGVDRVRSLFEPDARVMRALHRGET